jgi:hypothetical protein
VKVAVRIRQASGMPKMIQNRRAFWVRDSELDLHHRLLADISHQNLLLDEKNCSLVGPGK